MLPPIILTRAIRCLIQDASDAKAQPQPQPHPSALLLLGCRKGEGSCLHEIGRNSGKRGLCLALFANVAYPIAKESHEQIDRGYAGYFHPAPDSPGEGAAQPQPSNLEFE